MYRSTKGASKARRDQINAEIRNLKKLLPITDTDKARLSYLHIMSLACMYTRKSLFFSQEAPEDQIRGFMPLHSLLELMYESAFMLVVTGEGKLLYLSDNVVEHLGLCMVDLVIQSDSVYDFIDPIDHSVMRSSLASAATGDGDRLFRCRFNTSKFVRRQGAGNKPMLLRARCLTPPRPMSTYWTSNPVWVCFCTPLKATPPTHAPPTLTPPPEHSFPLASFHSRHLRDMTLVDVQDSVTVYLGYEVDCLRSLSWYGLLHPRDLSQASAQHRALLKGAGESPVEMVVQVEAADHTWVWLYMVLQLGGGEHPINCNNYVISESEAWSLRQQLCLEQNCLAGYCGAGDSMNPLSSETLDSPEQVFTPSLSVRPFDFTAAASGVSFSDETMRPAGPDARSSPEEESLTQTHGQQKWSPESIHFSSVPACNSPPVLLTEPDILTQRLLSHLANQSEPIPSSLTKPCAPVMPGPQQMGDIACTPHYTAHIPRGCFSFGERLQHLDPTTTTASPCPKPQSIVAPTITETFSQALSSDNPPLLLPTEYHRKTHPPTDSFRMAECNSFQKGECNSFQMGECNITALPEIRGPLFVDLPERSFHGPPEELLTPERFPTQQQQPRPSLFSVEKEQEREREEISLLARYISSLAEGFYCDPLLPKQTSSLLLPSSTLKRPSQNSLCDGECDPKRGLDRPLHHKDTSLYEESVLLEILLQDLCSFPSPPSYSSGSNFHSGSSSPRSPQTPASCCAPSHCEGEHSIGADHFSSVQLTQCNCRAVGGAVIGSGEVTMRNMEASPEDVMMDTSLLSQCTSLTGSQEPASVLARPTSTHTHSLPHAQFLMGELSPMDQAFEEDASIVPFWGDNLSCINSHSTTPSPSFHQGILRDPF